MKTLLQHAARMLLVLCIPVVAGAQGGSIDVAGIPDDPATLVEVRADAVDAAPGGRATARVLLRIRPTWHVNANPPALDYLIPTELSLESAAGITPGRPRYPAPHKTRLAFEATELLVYDGDAIVEVPLAIAANAAAGARTLAGTVQFQACNDQVCLAPATVPFRMVVSVAGPAAPADSGSTAAGDAVEGGDDPNVGSGPSPSVDFATAPPAGASTTGRLEEALARGGLVWFLALFVGGLLLNLTPCVFPMLGVTLSIFGARRQEPLPKVLTAAVIYVLGIVVMYSLLGVIAALTGGLFGAALQSVWVNVGLGLLLVALSLSMFGLYELQPPAWLLQRLGGSGTTSVMGLFASGLAVGIIAAPCVGPFVVAVLAIIAQKADPVFGFQTMFALAFGLGAPYIVLATFSNLLQKLPRSGDWMNWVKHAFGVILAAIGLFYVLLALAPEWSGWVMPVALVAGGLWLGFLDRTGGKPGFLRLRRVAGLAAITAGVFTAAAMPKIGIAFTAFDTETLARGQNEQRIAMVDFSADWCLPCHELDRNTFTDGRVRAAAKELLTLKVDLTRFNSPASEALRRQYRITGVPTVLFLAPDGSEIPGTRVEGFLPPGPFLERMRLAMDAGGAATR